MRQTAGSLFAGLAGLVFLLSAAAWLHIQAVRLSYLTQADRRVWDDLQRREQILDRRIMENLSLSRLDAWAGEHAGLAAPHPSQIRIMD